MNMNFKKLLITSSCLLFLSSCSKEEKEIVIEKPPIQSESVEVEVIEEKEIKDENNEIVKDKKIIDPNNTIEDTVSNIADKAKDVYQNTTQEEIKNTGKEILDHGINNVKEAGEIVKGAYNSDTVQNFIEDIPEDEIKNTGKEILDHGINNVKEAGEIATDAYNSDVVQDGLNKIKSKLMK